jgi:sulfate adenylyltransferase subunit 1 (EFTu-like GTPase family)
MDGELDEALRGDAVTVVLADAIDVSRGDIMSAPEKPPQRGGCVRRASGLDVGRPLLPGRTYLLKIRRQTIGAMVSELKYRIDVEHFDHLAAKELRSTRSAFVNIATASPSLRSVRREPRYRRIYPDRPAHQRDGRRRHDRFGLRRAAKRPLAGAST